MAALCDSPGYKIWFLHSMALPLWRLTHCSFMQAMKRQGTVDDEQLAKAHQGVQLQMQRMREAGGQAPRSLPPPRQESE